MSVTGRRLAACIVLSIVVQALALAWLTRPVSLPLSLPTLEVLLVSPKGVAAAPAPKLASVIENAEPASRSQPSAGESQPDVVQMPDPGRPAVETLSQAQKPGRQGSLSGAQTVPEPKIPPVDYSNNISSPQPMQPPATSPSAAPIVVAANAGIVLAIRQRLAQFQSYPASARRRGVEGSATVRFVISRRGELVDSELLQSSGSPHLDQAAIKLVADAAPYPPLPGSVGASRLEVKIPIEYRLKQPAT